MVQYFDVRVRVQWSYFRLWFRPVRRCVVLAVPTNCIDFNGAGNSKPTPKRPFGEEAAPGN